MPLLTMVLKLEIFTKIGDNGNRNIFSGNLMDLKIAQNEYAHRFQRNLYRTSTLGRFGLRCSIKFQFENFKVHRWYPFFQHLNSQKSVEKRGKLPRKMGYQRKITENCEIWPIFGIFQQFIAKELWEPCGVETFSM